MTRFQVSSFVLCVLMFACTNPGVPPAQADLLPAPAFRQPESNTTTAEQIEVRGYAQPNLTIEVYVNGAQVGTAYSDLTGEFSLAGVPLDLGRNVIRAVAVDALGRRSPDQVASTGSPEYAGSQLKPEIRITRR